MSTALNAADRAQHRSPARKRTELPAVSSFLLRGFNRYVPRYLRRHFNAVRLAHGTAPALPADEAVVCFVNHPSWWDPMMAILLNQRLMAGRIAYTPIAQPALDKYPIFRKLGFYGIDLDSLAGAKQFLSVTRGLLASPKTAVWMTPGGKFADARSPVTFQPGLGHLAATVSNVTYVPLAFEYPFWEERTPEALAEFGTPIRSRDVDQCKDAWREDLQSRLQATQASLAEKAVARDPSAFETLIDGSAGVGGWYGAARRMRSLLTGRGYNPRHAEDAKQETRR